MNKKKKCARTKGKVGKGRKIRISLRTKNLEQRGDGKQIVIFMF